VPPVRAGRGTRSPGAATSSSSTCATATGRKASPGSTTPSGSGRSRASPAPGWSACTGPPAPSPGRATGAAGPTGASRWPRSGRPRPSLRFERAAIKSQQEIDVPGALATAACHTWPGHEGQVRGYATLKEVKAALRPHLLDQPGWEQLREATAVWEATWRKARPLLSAAVRAHGEEFSRLSAAYDAAVTAANNAYRAQHEQAAETGSAAA
jgi:hypothetical protein